MMSPSSLLVFALKFLQKSMILTPCGPSAVPTGGAGVAFPAGIWSFTIACTFFAMNRVSRRYSRFATRGSLLAVRGSLFAVAGSRFVIRGTPNRELRTANRDLQLLHLQEIQFHRRRAAE